MSHATERHRVGNVTHLRDAIDRGTGADKVRNFDPAAAPLGTDDEAAGTPPTPEQVARRIREEVVERPAPARGNGMWIWAIATLAVAVLLIFAIT